MTPTSDFWKRSIMGVPLARDVFIETGAKSGDTLWAAKDYFDVCHSIEINAKAHRRCVERFRDLHSVCVHLGDSREILPLIIDASRATTFYLDAHCEGAPSTVPESDTECPLLEEIEIIIAAPWTVRPVILIDDIHMMTPEYWNDPASNHALFTPGDWPRFDQIQTLLRDYRYYGEIEKRIGAWF